MRACKICNKEYELSESGAGYKYCSQYCSDEARRIRKRERMRKVNNLYEKYEEQRCCKRCGKDISCKPLGTVYCSYGCRETDYRRLKGQVYIEEHLKSLAEQKERTQARIDKKREETQKARDDAKRMREIEIERAKKQKWESLPVKQCVICDTNFRSFRYAQVTCSNECKWTYRNQVSKAYSKAYRMNSKYKGIVVDKDITLEKLFERDKGVCHICQRQCSFEDYRTINGGFAAGKLYPTVDHVIPRSKGGVHSWDNVKLAHHYCNSIKNDCQDKKEVIKRLLKKI